MTRRIPDPPATLDTAALSRPSPHAGADFEASISPHKSIAPVATGNNVDTTPTPQPRVNRPPRLPRISSDCELEETPGANEEITAHSRHFKDQIEGEAKLHISADPETDQDVEIAADPATSSIYDAYFLRANVTWHVSSFQRLRVIFNPRSRKYALTWKPILQASSFYRALILYPCGDRRPHVISNQVAIFLKLRYSHSLWQWHGISDLLKEVYLRGSLHEEASWSLARPLYHAYSSLGHGFRRLDDPNTTKFLRLKAYLETFCQFCPLPLVSVEGNISRLRQAGRAESASGLDQSNEAVIPHDEQRLLLWHDTSLDSLLEILDVGLQIKKKESSFTGSMFGSGIYLADVSSKSADVGYLAKVTQSNAYELAAACQGIRRCVQGMWRIGLKNWVAVDWPLVGEPLGGTVQMVRVQFQ
ncbi:hypothetical protein VUR80DRAFT_1302 [Thermomyces stellatus]